MLIESRQKLSQLKSDPHLHIGSEGISSSEASPTI